MNSFRNVVDELVGNMPALLNEAYEMFEESNAKVKEKFSYAQIKTLEKMNKFGWAWSSYNNETGAVTCSNYKNKSKAYISVDGTYKRS